MPAIAIAKAGRFGDFLFEIIKDYLLEFRKMKKLFITIPNAWSITALCFLQLLLATPNYGQNDNDEDFCMLATERAWPDLPMTKEDSSVIPCRKMKTKPLIFYDINKVKSIKDIHIGKYNELTQIEKGKIIRNAWHTKDTSLQDILIHIALYDTVKDSQQRYDREMSIEFLNVYKNDATRKTLLILLCDPDRHIGMISALSLIQCGEFKESMKFIKQNYKEYKRKPVIVDAMMNVNSPDAIEIMKEIAKDPDPSYALDALAGLSLLGYCDYAFEGFKTYTMNQCINARRFAARCLAYYSGTSEAFEVVLNMQSDPDPDVREEIDKIRAIYHH